ncbi:tigger transposable element-derived protein 1 [Trichonephila clavipes]|nr:tigger transposable element-derived protein 1 [Trichonephila clavipes]
MNEMGLEFKILLILDNAPDQGIISTFKKYYVKFTFQFIFDKLESETITVTEAWKQFNILNCVNHVALEIAEIKSQTLNACWKAAWPECVSKGNESNRAIVTSEIISIAKEIGGEGFDDFGEHDIEELLVDEALNDDDILESMVDITKDLETVDSEPEEDVTPLDEKLLREGLQLSGKLANFFYSK